MAEIDYMCERTEDIGTRGKIELVNCLCSKADTVQYTCTVYTGELPPFYMRRRCCPFNQPVKHVNKRRRVGQQKQKRKGW
jgi:hypothetical protein